MDIKGSKELDVRELAEENFVDSPVSISKCSCAEERNLRVSLSELPARAVVFTPDHVGVKGARCATFGRCR